MINMARFNKAVAVTTSDTVDFVSSGKGSSGQANLCDALYVGGTGDVIAVLQDNTEITFKAVPVGTILPVAARRVKATGTTATLMVALFQL